jgi:hypothetical protein
MHERRDCRAHREVETGGGVLNEVSSKFGAWSGALPPCVTDQNRAPIQLTAYRKPLPGHCIIAASDLERTKQVLRVGRESYLVQRLGKEGSKLHGHSGFTDCFFGEPEGRDIDRILRSEKRSDT